MLKTFVSYKWQDEAHDQWVEKFATDLRAANIDAQLDRWEIRAGDSLTDYMTSRIDDADVILCIITDEYVTNVEAPEGQGGATKFEMQMAVSRRTAGENVRLIGIYRQGSKQPHYLRDHLYVDFRDDGKYAEQLKCLVDDLRGETKRPPLGFPQLNELEVWTNSIGLQMALLPPGHFLMGSPDTDEHAREDEMQHRVQITKPFLMGVYPVTQEQYQAVEMRNPSKYVDGHRPVENIDWQEAILFCNRLSQREHLRPYYDIQASGVSVAGGSGYRLPTEAEWEYACRAGSATRYCFGDDEEQLSEYAWFGGNSGTHTVGAKQPNSWGLYDMHGNVWEWCWDWHQEDYYRHSPQEDPPGPSEGSLRVNRGGGCGYAPQYCRSADRYWFSPSHRDNDLGFRVARSSG